MNIKLDQINFIHLHSAITSHKITTLAESKTVSLIFTQELMGWKQENISDKWGEFQIFLFTWHQSIITNKDIKETRKSEFLCSYIKVENKVELKTLKLYKQEVYLSISMQ